MRMINFTACYRKLEHGYMGQLLEWPGVITEGEDINDCRDLLVEAASEMSSLYKDEGQKIPHPSFVVENVSVPIDEEALLEDEEEALLVNVG